MRFEKLKSGTLRKDRVEVEGDMGSDKKIAIREKFPTNPVIFF